MLFSTSCLSELTRAYIAQRSDSRAVGTSVTLTFGAMFAGPRPGELRLREGGLQAALPSFRTLRLPSDLRLPRTHPPACANGELDERRDPAPVLGQHYAHALVRH